MCKCQPRAVSRSTPRRRPAHHSQQIGTTDLHAAFVPVHPRHSRREGHTVSVSIKPLEDRIVVKSSEAEQTTASGLVIPDTAKEKPQEGEVLAIGPGRID